MMGPHTELSPVETALGLCRVLFCINAICGLENGLCFDFSEVTLNAPS